jgi:hypothetical protein
MAPDYCRPAKASFTKGDQENSLLPVLARGGTFCTARKIRRMGFSEPRLCPLTIPRLRRVFSHVSAAILLAAWPACAREAPSALCGLFAPQYQFASDTVVWLLATGGAPICVRSFRIRDTFLIDKSRLISQPQFGRAALVGPGFEYRTDSKFKGMDFFEVEVSGKRNGISGTSTIQIVVSVP